MSRYASGANYERRARDYIISRLGLPYVCRSAGSKGKVDLVAWGTKGSLAVQVKAVKKLPENGQLPADLRKEYRALRKMSRPKGMRVQLWVYVKRTNAGLRPQLRFKA